jgi:eukaryotic-like serine/threonine-protein kinase
MSKELSANTNLSHYRIERKIGAGGMGEVYLAEDLRLNRKVALKVLPENIARDKDRLRRFEQEARAASALNHPNILTVYEFGFERDVHFLATELIEGETLRETINGGELSVTDALVVAEQTAFALSAAHSAGVVHRDLKPENIMIRRDRVVKILDFGLAKLIEKKEVSPDTEAETRALVKTNPGVVMGTASYMSPEQARGKDTDARTDIFSLGCVLYEMLTRRLPFSGETINDIIAAILTKEPEPLSSHISDVPKELERIINKTLRKDREERYQHIKDLLIDLRDLRRDLEFEAKLERSTAPSKAEQEATNKIAAVTEIQNAPTTSSAEYIVSEIRKNKLAFISALAIVLLACGALGFWYFGNRSANPLRIKSIAVLPFHNASGNADTEYLSDGITESLIGSLSLLPELDVKASNSVFRYKGKEVELKKIGQDLSVQALLTGRVVQRADGLTLYIELVDAATEKVLWKADYNRQMTNLVSMQNEITRDISTRLRVKLSGAEEQRLAKNYTNNSEAYQLYLRGRFFWNKRTPKDIENSIPYFQQSIAADPSFALAFSGLADSYMTFALLEGGPPPHEVMPKARDAAHKALMLDDRLGEAHATLGFILLLYDYDFAGSEREFKRAIELEPNYATAHLRYSLLLTTLGRHEESLVKIRRALEIDPLSVFVNRGYGDRLIDARKYDEAIIQLKKTLELDSNFALAHSSLSWVYHVQGNYAGSVEEIAKTYELTGRQEYAALARESFIRGGWHGYLLAMTERRSDLRAYTRAIFYAALGNKDKAFDELNKAYENREYNLSRLKVDPRLDPLRDDARFEELLRKIGFPP